jgi:hypothetical protein
LDIGVLGYIGIFEHKEHPPEDWHIPAGTLCTQQNRNIMFKQTLSAVFWTLSVLPGFQNSSVSGLSNTPLDFLAEPV